MQPKVAEFCQAIERSEIAPHPWSDGASCYAVGFAGFLPN
jgi:hypothetical protein